MKRIINGTRYDTETATAVGTYESNHFTTDFEHWTATLYISPRKKYYFLHGTGGPMSRYGEPSGNCWVSGEKLEPLSCEEAMRWAEEYLEPEEMDKGFGHLVTDA